MTQAEIDQLLGTLRRAVEVALYPGVSPSLYALAFNFKKLDKHLSQEGGPWPTAWQTEEAHDRTVEMPFGPPL